MRIFDGTITSVEHYYDRQAGNVALPSGGPVREMLRVEADSLQGSTALLEFENKQAGYAPALVVAPGSSLHVERDPANLGDVHFLVNNVRYYQLEVVNLSITQSAPGPMASFGGAVKRSWECPESLQREAQERAAVAGMTVTFDVNKLTVVTNRGTLHVTVDPPVQMAGFTADMCMLTWQVELRELGLAA